VVVLLVPIVLPGVAERMLQGFGQTDVTGQSTIDDYSITSGRSLVWPHVIDQIVESPMVGYGRLGMKRSGLTQWLRSNYGVRFPHPHNMYLETLLDNGILGSLPIFIFWGMMALYSARLFRSNNRLYSLVGGLAFSLIMAQSLAGLGSQHFYPRETTLGMWAATFLLLRVYVEEKRARADLTHAEDPMTIQYMPEREAYVDPVRV